MNLIYTNPGLLLLRLGLVIVYVYFGISQLLNPSMWSGVVPGWTVISFLEPITVVYINATFELVFAALLAIGVWSKWVSIILGVHLGIITLAIGFNPVGVRDFGLTLATFAHGFWKK
ncbi:MAG: DoxX family membrane protein [Parcubacteria group bacterium]